LYLQGERKTRPTPKVRDEPSERCETGDDADDLTEGDSAQKELFAAWALFISIVLLITAFFTSYLLQQKKVTAIHETVISIFGGMDSEISQGEQVRCSC
jgi:hypothetical protein